MLKSKTQTKTNAANALTITSPNTKMAFLKAYLVTGYGSAVGTTDVTIQVTDEDSNVLWQDSMNTGTIAQGMGLYRASYEFPGLGLPIPVKKNCTVTVSSGGANYTTELNLLYNI